MCAGPVDAADIETSGADAAEAQGEVGDEPEAAAPQLQGEDDFEAVEADEEEDEVQHLGGEGFSAAELAAAEAALGISSKVSLAELGCSLLAQACNRKTWSEHEH